jgi:hypothetical protein
MNASAEKQRQKEIEFACIEAVARARGCKAMPENEANQWPDGRLEHADGKKELVEVVAAFKRPADEDPTQGSSYKRYSKKAESLARARAEGTGEPVSWHVGDHGFMLLDGVTPLPVATEPLRLDKWILSAVEQKIDKHYAYDTPTVLIVQLHSPLPLIWFEIERLAEGVRTLRTRFKFAALWVVNNYGDPPVKIPTAFDPAG